jgi:hypothetical protein
VIKRTAFLLILLLLLAVGQLHAVPVDPIDPTDAGHKATAQSEEGSEHVPASNPWAMMVMVMLVLTASTVAVLGGGPNQRGATASMARGIEFEPAEPVKPSKSVMPKAKKAKASRKPKLDPEQRQLGRQGWNISRRQNTHGRPGGRRSGPGCRGIR